MDIALKQEREDELSRQGKCSLEIFAKHYAFKSPAQCKRYCKYWMEGRKDLIPEYIRKRIHNIEKCGRDWIITLETDLTRPFHTLKGNEFKSEVLNMKLDLNYEHFHGSVRVRRGTP